MSRGTGAKVALPAPTVRRSGDASKPARTNRVKHAKAAADPRFQRLLLAVAKNGKAARRRSSAAQKADEAQAAATPPTNERIAGAKADRVDEMDAAQGRPPQTGGFLALLRQQIAALMPANNDEAEKLGDTASADPLKGAARGPVQSAQGEAAGPVTQAAAAAPDPGGVPARAPTPSPADAPGPTTAAPVADAVPTPRTNAEISQERNNRDADQRMRDAEVTRTQLGRANDPRFSSVNAARDNVTATVAASPGRFRATEGRALAAGRAGAAAAAQQGVAGMRAGAIAGHSGAASRQAAARAKDEARRKAVVDKIEAIFAKTKADVDGILAPLEAAVTRRFEVGVDLAMAEMKATAKTEIAAFKRRRYSGVIGAGRWVADLFGDVHPEIKAILANARTRFTSRMDQLAVAIAGEVDARVAAAKARVAAGKAQVAGYVASLPSDLRGVGRDAQAALQAKFDELEQGIEQRQQALAESLAQKYKDAMDAADAAVKKMEDENKGALKGLVDKLGEIIKIIAEMKDKLMAALRKGWETIKLILADPIGFLSNLLSAVKGGLQAFVGNIVTHLKTALFEWLLGPLGAAGISVPRDFSLTSIFKLVLDVLGLTWPKIRQRAVAILGETTVKVLETAAEFVAIFIRGGPAALWEKIKESLSDLKSIVIDGIRDWVISTIVTQGVTRIVSMFNPAGAFVQACIAIYNVVMFLVERAAQIWAFVQSIIDSVHAIATGSIGGAIRLVEASLARLLPLVISFLARLIGLGGITGKILGIIRKIQAKVEQAIDKVIGFLGKGIKRMLSGISRGVTSLAKAGANKVADMIRQGKSVAVVRPLLAGIKAAMRLSMLDVSETKTAVVVKAAASPTETETVEKGKVGPLSFPRPKFSGKLTRAMKLKDGQARRHVISYSDMASHYTKGLAPKTFDDAWKDLAAVPQGANKVAVTKLASGDDAAHRTAIGGTAQKMLKAFNEDAENLSPGPTIPNSALQENVDLRALFEKQAVPDAPLTAIRTVETKTERPVDAAWLARTAGAQDKMKTGLSQHITKVVGKYMLPGGSLAISNSLGLEITASFDATTKSATLVVSKAAA